MNEKDRIEVDRSTQVNSRKKRKKWYNVLKTKTRFIKVPENVDEETLSAQVNENIEKKHRISGSGLLKGAVATGMLFGGAAMQNMTAYANENEDSTSENITEDDHDDTSSSDATDSDTSSSESDASDSEGSSDTSSDDSDEETVEVESEVEVEAADSEPDTETREAETSDDTDKVFPLKSIEQRIAVLSMLGFDISRELTAYKDRLQGQEQTLLDSGTKNLEAYQEVMWMKQVFEKYHV